MSICFCGFRDEFSSEKVKLYFCKMQGDASDVSPLKLDLFGNIEPENFMGDAFGETAAAEKARLRRMQAAQ